MTQKNIKKLVIASLFIALDIIITRFFSFEIPTLAGPLRLNFQVIVAAFCGYMLGPLAAGFTLLTADLLGAFINSGSLGIFLGFTLSAFIRGLLMGFILKTRKPSPLRLSLSVFIVCSVTDILLNTLWLSVMTTTPFTPLLIGRLIPKLIFMIIITILLASMHKCFPLISKKSNI